MEELSGVFKRVVSEERCLAPRLGSSAGMPVPRPAFGLAGVSRCTFRTWSGPVSRGSGSPGRGQVPWPYAFFPGQRAGRAPCALGFGSGLLLSFADGGFPWRLSGWGLPGLGTVPAVVLWELECVLEKTSFCRAGGETMGFSDEETEYQGLSPRGRGNLAERDTTSAWTGSIPAWAGKPRFG